MQFGKALHPENIDFFLPEDHPNTLQTLQKNNVTEFELRVGCAKWNRQDLKNFYPKGTKDELAYYSSQFNSIELNATFYNLFPKEQFRKWHKKTSNNFKFFPKLSRQISHDYQLDSNAIEYSKYFIENVSELNEKLGGVFLQLHEDFSPKHFNNLENYIIKWPKQVPLSVEFRHTNWFNTSISKDLSILLNENKITTIITDTAGRRDLLHMNLTTPKAFIRFVGANHKTDYSRIDEWVNRLINWKNNGVEEISFFLHQNIEIESVKLAAYLIKKINQQLTTTYKAPNTLEDSQQMSLF